MQILALGAERLLLEAEAIDLRIVGVHVCPQIVTLSEPQ